MVTGELWWSGWRNDGVGGVMREWWRGWFRGRWWRTCCAGGVVMEGSGRPVYGGTGDALGPERYGLIW